MWQLFMASFSDQTDIEGNGWQRQDKTWQMFRSLSLKRDLISLGQTLVIPTVVFSWVHIYLRFWGAPKSYGGSREEGCWKDAYFCGIVKWKQVSLVSCWILSQTGLDLIKRVWTWSACRVILKRTVNKPVCMGGITLQGVSTLCPAEKVTQDWPWC